MLIVSRFIFFATSTIDPISDLGLFRMELFYDSVKKIHIKNEQTIIENSCITNVASVAHRLSMG